MEGQQRGEEDEETRVQKLKKGRIKQTRKMGRECQWMKCDVFVVSSIPARASARVAPPPADCRARDSAASAAFTKNSGMGRAGGTKIKGGCEGIFHICLGERNVIVISRIHDTNTFHCGKQAK